MPPFLVDYDFYFTKTNNITVPDEVCENLSDSEIIQTMNYDDIDKKL